MPESRSACAALQHIIKSCWPCVFRHSEAIVAAAIHAALLISANAGADAFAESLAAAEISGLLCAAGACCQPGEVRAMVHGFARELRSAGITEHARVADDLLQTMNAATESHGDAGIVLLAPGGSWFAE